MHNIFGAPVDCFIDDIHGPPVDGEAGGASGQQEKSQPKQHWA
jgi:hypothetical protein